MSARVILSCHWKVETLYISLLQFILSPAILWIKKSSSTSLSTYVFFHSCHNHCIDTCRFDVHMDCHWGWNPYSSHHYRSCACALLCEKVRNSKMATQMLLSILPIEVTGGAVFLVSKVLIAAGLPDSFSHGRATKCIKCCLKLKAVRNYGECPQQQRLLQNSTL